MITIFIISITIINRVIITNSIICAIVSSFRTSFSRTALALVTVSVEKNTPTILKYTMHYYNVVEYSDQ